MANARRSNFDLNKSVNLRDIDLQKKELVRQRTSGLRDIGQAREEGLQKAVNNALQRGIFRSGITQENKQKVERESGEASGDLRERIGISLDRLANRRRGESGQKFIEGGGSGAGGLVDIIASFIDFLEGRDAANAVPDFAGGTPPPIVPGEPG